MRNVAMLSGTSLLICGLLIGSSASSQPSANPVPANGCFNEATRSWMVDTDPKEGCGVTANLGSHPVCALTGFIARGAGGSTCSLERNTYKHWILKAGEEADASTRCVATCFNLQ